MSAIPSPMPAMPTDPLFSDRMAQQHKQLRTSSNEVPSPQPDAPPPPQKQLTVEPTPHSSIQGENRQQSQQQQQHMSPQHQQQLQQQQLFAQLQQQQLQNMYQAQMMHAGVNPNSPELMWAAKMMDPYSQGFMMYPTVGASSNPGMSWVATPQQTPDGTWVPAPPVGFDPYIAAAAQQQALMALAAGQVAGIDTGTQQQADMASAMFYSAMHGSGPGATSRPNMPQGFAQPDLRGRNEHSSENGSPRKPGQRMHGIGGPGRSSFSGSPGKVIGTEHFASIVNQDALPQRRGVSDCAFYLQHGRCAYGSVCKFNHPPEVARAQQPAAYNLLGLPLRPGAQECAYYVKTGTCKFGSTCKFNHPDLAHAMMHENRAIHFANMHEHFQGHIPRQQIPLNMHMPIESMQNLSLGSQTPVEQQQPLVAPQTSVEPEFSPKLESRAEHTEANPVIDNIRSKPSTKEQVIVENTTVERKVEDVDDKDVDAKSPQIIAKVPDTECDPEMPPSLATSA